MEISKHPVLCGDHKSPVFDFYKVSEHDIDVLLLHLFSLDMGIYDLFAMKAGIKVKSVKLDSVELSKADARFGESDITAIFSNSSKKIALLIEDKIDAIAMPEQPERYIKRGNKAVKTGEYDEFYSFIICPQKYYDNNDAAKKYPCFVSYEEIKEHLLSLNNPQLDSFIQQLEQAIEKAKRPPQVILNEKANVFFRSYKDYQEQNYPILNLRTKRESNGYWAQYATNLGNAYIHHKIQEGKVDLTFSNAATRMNDIETMASWLRSHNMPNVRAEVAGKAGVLHIDVPVLNMTISFEENNQSDIEECFKAIKSLTEVANVLALSSEMAGL